MGAPGDQLNFHPAHGIRSMDCLIMQDGFLYAFSGFRNYNCHLPRLIPEKQVPQCTRLFPGAAVEHRKVFLLKIPFPHLPGKLRCCLGISRQHHQPGNNPVQPVNRAKIPLRFSQRFPQ